MNLSYSGPVTIFDDFYPSLDWLYPHLENNVPIKREDVNYPGVVYAPPRIQTDWAIAKLKSLLPGLGDTSHPTQGEIRMTLQSDKDRFRSFIHYEKKKNIIIYLSPVFEQEEWGTTFYRHKDLNVFRIEPDSDFEKKMKILLQYDSKILDRWEVIERIPYRQNRAISFDGCLLHSIPIDFFGTDYKSGRLTQNFFL